VTSPGHCVVVKFLPAACLVMVWSAAMGPSGIAAATEARAAPCLASRPASVNLKGQVLVRTYPGPPNYGESADDSHENVFLLLLDTPVCVEGVASPREGQRRDWDVVLVQLFRGPAMRTGLVPWAGKHVVVTGQLDQGTSAGDRTPVVVLVQSVLTAQ
jgi:hypothetical protein